MLNMDGEPKERSKWEMSVYGTFVLDSQTLEELACLHRGLSAYPSPDWSQIAFDTGTGGVSIWHRRRPEYWWGVAWLPEFWLTLAISIGLVWNVWRDWRRLKIT